ncbi:MAG: hypothetical protein AAFX07_00690 [Pseudomonadota bacterium]
MKTFITAKEVAEKLGLSRDGFRRRIDFLIDHEDFPMAMPYSGPRGTSLWRASQVDAWLANQGLPKIITPPRITHDDPKVVQLRREAARV